MSQVTNLPVYKPSNETSSSIEEATSSSIFEYTSTQNQTVKSAYIKNVENTPTQKIYNYSVTASKQDKNKSQSKIEFSNITSKFSNYKASENSPNFSQTNFASKSNSSISNNQQQLPFQEVDNADNLQTMQKSGPTGNPGDPGIIPVGDGTVLLLMALGCYTIFKFKTL